MITELQLKNFRGFEDHVVPLHPLTIVVGKNNAGKSTIVEALRLVSIVVSRFKGDLTSIPHRWDFPRSKRGSHPFSNLEINLRSVFYRYGVPPAVIRAVFSSGETVEVTIDESEIYARRIKAKKVTPSPHISRVSILPQVAPVARDERLLTEDYVRSALSSALAPQHFRNQLRVLSEHFEAFKAAAEQTWPSLRIRALETFGEPPNPLLLSLLVEDNHFSAEVAWMGHGLQMWLQMVWFLTRARDHETVILDEPDVYMHADLQRRLLRFVRGRHQQIVIATHSTEIMAEVLPENILIVDRSKRRSSFASSLPAVQQVLNRLGSIHNIQLSRLWSAKRFLMVEGEDVAILKQFQNRMFPETDIPIDTIPSASIGGWSGWNQAVGSEVLLKNSGGEGIVSYCLLDSDYFTPDVIKSRYADAKKRGISLHIWRFKELENLLLAPGAISRAIQSQTASGSILVGSEEIEKQLLKIAEALKQDLVDCVATQIHSADRKLTVGTANQRARQAVEKRWTTTADRLGVVPGKEAFSLIARWVQETHGVSISAALVAHHIQVGEMPEELRAVLTAIERCEPFPVPSCDGE